MHDCIKRERHLENNAIVVRDIAICIRLIDIFMEDDAVYNTWLHQSFSGKLKFRKLEINLYELAKSARALIFLSRYRSRRVNNQHFIVGQAVKVIDQEVDLLL